MQFVRPDIVTFCVGQAASMAAVLLAAGTKGKRFSLPNSRIMIHQPSMQGLAGQAADIDIYAKEILRMRETLNKILADYYRAAHRPHRPRRGSRLHHERRAGRGVRHDRPRRLQPRSGADARLQANPPRMRLQDKTAIITGVGAGIGEAIAIRFAEEGAHLVLNDIQENGRRGDAATR